MRNLTKTMQTIEEITHILRVSLFMGYISQEEIIKWADNNFDQVKNIELIEVSLSKTQKELISVLNDLGKGFENHEFIAGLFLSHLYLSLNRGNLEDIETQLIKFQDLNYCQNDELLFSMIRNDYSLYEHHLPRADGIFDEIRKYLKEHYTLTFIDRISQLDGKFYYTEGKLIYNIDAV